MRDVMGTDQRRNRAVGIEDAGRVALGTADADFVRALNRSSDDRLRSVSFGIDINGVLSASVRDF